MSGADRGLLFLENAAKAAAGTHSIPDMGDLLAALDQPPGPAGAGTPGRLPASRSASIAAASSAKLALPSPTTT